MSDIPGTPADGHVKVVWVPSGGIASLLAPTVAELNDVDNVDMSCYLTSDGWNPTLDESTVTDDRLCDVETFELPGRSSRSLSVKFVENPTDTPNNKAYTTLVPDTVGYFVVRRGLLYDAAWAASQKVQVWSVRMGGRDWQAPEQNSMLRVVQKAFVGARVKEATVAA